MSISRCKLKRNFTVLPNQIIRLAEAGGPLELQDLGLIAFIFSKPDNWETSYQLLRKQLGVSNDKIVKMLKRLKDVGILEIHKDNSTGHAEWTFTDSPISYVTGPHSENQNLKTRICKPESENKSVLIKTDSIKTDLLNTKREGAKRATALKDDFVMQECEIQWAMNEKGWSEEKARQVSLIFKDHWLGNGKPMKDWVAVWRNWVRRENQFTQGNGRTNKAVLRVPPATDERELKAMAREMGINTKKYNNFYELRQGVLTAVEKLYAGMH